MNQLLWGVAVFAASFVVGALLGVAIVEVCGPLDPAEAVPGGAGIRSHS